jgi:hypothetical protein
MNQCPVCHRDAHVASEPDIHRNLVTCPGCGKFAIDTDFLADWRWSAEEGARLSHAIRKMQRVDSTARIDVEPAWKLVREPLPSAREQADSLILWAGSQLRLADPARPIRLADNKVHECVATVGGVDHRAIAYLAAELQEKGLVKWQDPSLGLTLDGWERYEEIVRGSRTSKIAFMAMSFRDDRIQAAFRECFRPAAARAGYELRPVTDGQPAGVIDDQIRVAIRRARFVIADLTGGNHGAYWEAGFGEGLGKPVIYTCEAGEFETQKTHFDTNHCLTVPWSLDQLPAAENRLVATIRATLPDEAKIED